MAAGRKLTQRLSVGADQASAAASSKEAAAAAWSGGDYESADDLDLQMEEERRLLLAAVSGLREAAEAAVLRAEAAEAVCFAGVQQALEAHLRRYVFSEVRDVVQREVSEATAELRAATRELQSLRSPSVRVAEVAKPGLTEEAEAHAATWVADEERAEDNDREDHCENEDEYVEDDQGNSFAAALAAVADNAADAGSSSSSRNATGSTSLQRQRQEPCRVREVVASFEKQQASRSSTGLRRSTISCSSSSPRVSGNASSSAERRSSLPAVEGRSLVDAAEQLEMRTPHPVASSLPPGSSRSSPPPSPLGGDEELHLLLSPPGQQSLGSSSQGQDTLERNMSI
eukprot:TRINITY_DN63226_c0_g1_i1.p1 TRINITY_DN63226_c0_g1~~TRINITY_DN63226_c0_g1_i1.p1  ORF type:complete len:382 (+),score=92.62 TRINITY_DN63226_c0_g1_i1:118-1146(+)